MNRRQFFGLIGAALVTPKLPVSQAVYPILAPEPAPWHSAAGPYGWELSAAGPIVQSCDWQVVYTAGSAFIWRRHGDE